MTDSRASLAASLDAEEEILPFIPLLLQDLWALGFSPDSALALLSRNVPATPRRVLDLGCGKGALVVHIAQQFGWTCRGIDIVPEFIAEANRIARIRHLTHLLQFEVKDMADEVEMGGQYDLIVFGFDSEALGPLAAALSRIRKRLTTPGYVLLDTIWAKPGRNQGDIATETETLSAARAAGLRLVDREILDRHLVEAQNASNTEHIRRRASELAETFPAHASAFHAYVRRQEDESRMLSEDVHCACLLFSTCPPAPHLLNTPHSLLTLPHAPHS